jgi:CRP-like cAMP-binding protein
MEMVERRFRRFGRLGPRDFEFLSDVVSRSEPLAARHTVFGEGRHCRQMYLLVDGWVAEYRLLFDGGRQILQLRLPGEVFGLDCLGYGVSLHAVQTLTACQVGAIPVDDYQRVKRDHPLIFEALFRMALFERAISHEWAVSLGRRPAWSRVAHLLLELTERCALTGLVDERVPLPLTQQDLADCTGLTIGYVNRVLRDMRSRDLIELTTGSLVIKDKDSLARFAGFKARYLNPLLDPPGEVDANGGK